MIQEAIRCQRSVQGWELLSPEQGPQSEGADRAGGQASGGEGGARCRVERGLEANALQGSMNTWLMAAQVRDNNELSHGESAILVTFPSNPIPRLRPYIVHFRLIIFICIARRWGHHNMDGASGATYTNRISYYFPSMMTIHT